jgi:tRNA(fMet)-specific endonuclease VapC
VSRIVLDTDVVSFLFKSDSRAELFLPYIQRRLPIISFMTEAELEQWILLSRWGSLRVDRFREFMLRFAVVPSSRDLVVKWAETMGERTISRPPD